MPKKIIYILLIVASAVINQAVWARENHLGRLGVGASNQLANDLTALSFKVQKSNAFALGGLLGVSTDNNNGGYGAGLKLYRILFEEPQLTFYFAGLGALINHKTTTTEKSGFQFDLTMGTEFSFAGLESLGFTLEFGFSFNKLNDFVVETVGDHLIAAGVHFYL